MNHARASRIRKAGVRFCVLAMTGALGWVSASTASVLGCRQEPTPVRFDGGAKLGYCSGFTAVPIAASECASEGCSGGAYALCNGTTFDECACDLPSSYSLDAGTFEPDAKLIDEGGLTAFTPDADIGLPCCLGDTVVEIPAVDCPSHCAGPVGYAVCHDNSYSECACSIPTGFKLADITCDGG